MPAIVPIFVLFVLPFSAHGMDRVWTRMTGQTPVEAPPLVIDLDQDVEDEILILNRGGQILHWTPEGEPIGSGQDGTVLELPKGLWSSAIVPLRFEDGEVLLLACSVEGLVVAIDAKFHVAWKHQIETKTQFGRAIPLVLGKSESAKIFIGDLSGSVTCLDSSGSVVWNRDLESGPCRARLSVAPSLEGKKPSLLAGAGCSLFSVDPTNGETIWERELADPILSKPEILKTTERMMILCGAGEGSLYALTMDGDIIWKTEIGDQIDSSIAFLEQSDGETAILCLGLWGNLVALDQNGKILWKSLYEAKSRACPVVIDGNGDGKNEI